MKRFWSKVEVRGMDECWTWVANTTPTGYGMFWFKGKMRRAHRVAWILTNGPIPDGLCVCHRCDNPGCMNPQHLFLATQEGNIQDRVQKGRSARPRGEEINTAKITAKQAVEIRRRTDEGEVPARIAEDYPISRRMVAAIKNRENWRHV